MTDKELMKAIERETPIPSEKLNRMLAEAEAEFRTICYDVSDKQLEGTMIAHANRAEASQVLEEMIDRGMIDAKSMIICFKIATVTEILRRRETVEKLNAKIKS